MFPTSVGMNRLMKTALIVVADVPHIRGDEPPDRRITKNAFQCSPHPWG